MICEAPAKEDLPEQAEDFACCGGISMGGFRLRFIAERGREHENRSLPGQL